jgi:hypothetical protein
VALNSGIERAKVGIDTLDVLVLEVVNNQCIEFLGAGGGHLEKWSGKWERGGKQGGRRGGWDH